MSAPAPGRDALPGTRWKPRKQKLQEGDGTLNNQRRWQEFPGGELTIGGQVQGHGNSYHSPAGINYLKGNLLILLKKDRVGTGLSIKALNSF